MQRWFTTHCHALAFRYQYPRSGRLFWRVCVATPLCSSLRVKLQVFYCLLQVKGVALTIGVLECLSGKLIIVNEVAAINANTYNGFIKALSCLQNDCLILHKAVSMIRSSHFPAFSSSPGLFAFRLYGKRTNRKDSHKQCSMDSFLNPEKTE